MIEISFHLFFSVLAISLLHAILPNHWLPVVALSRQFNWNVQRTCGVMALAAVAHSLSTVIIGVILAYGGFRLESMLPYFRFIAAGILVLLGIFFIWRHQHHHHFHLRAINPTEPNMVVIIGSLLVAMFFSPCLEVGALFLVAGVEGMKIVWSIAAIYTITSALGMTFFAWLALQGLQKIDWHKLEHNTGIISGVILIVTGILFLFLH